MRGSPMSNGLMMVWFAFVLAKFWIDCLMNCDWLRDSDKAALSLSNLDSYSRASLTLFATISFRLAKSSSAS